MATLRISTIFVQAANSLPKEEKAKLLKAFMLLTNDPRHPSLQVKKIKGAHRSDIYECRLDQSWRIILKDAGDMTFDLVYVGAHDEAISFGARLHEPRTQYSSSNRSILDLLNAYLEGNDKALDFFTVTQADLDSLIQ